MKWQEHTKCLNPSLSNSTKTTNTMEEYGRNNKEEIHKELQDLDPMGSPHKEENVTGGNRDLDLLSLFPQRYARIMAGIKRRASFPRSTMEGDMSQTYL
jgi:hypothetical protein